MEAQKVYFLLTYWGTLLSAEPGLPGLHQVHLAPDYKGNALPFRVDGTALASLNAPSQRFEIYRHSSDGLISLRRDGLYLCAVEGGPATISRGKPSSWEKFLLLSEADVDEVLFLLNNDWIERLTRDVLRRNNHRLLSAFRIQLGSRTLQLVANIPITVSATRWHVGTDNSPSGFLACTVWQDFWKPLELLLLRPLIFYCAFGAKALSMVSTSLRSLQTLGGYEQDILLLTNMSRQEVTTQIPGWLDARLHIQDVSAADYLDFCSARYLVTDWSLGHQFQPILYVDADVVFDLNSEEMLIDLALGGKMSAQAEPGATLARHAPVGAQLFREAGINPGNAVGFNAGIFGITSLEKHGNLLKTIHLAIYRYAEAKGSRTALSHFDQSFANYVSFITDSLDLSICSKYIRWAHSKKIHGGDRPMGLVHFWGLADKQEEMENYLDSLSNTGDCTANSEDSRD